MVTRLLSSIESQNVFEKSALGTLYRNAFLYCYAGKSLKLDKNVKSYIILACGRRSSKSRTFVGTHTRMARHYVPKNYDEKLQRGSWRNSLRRCDSSRFLKSPPPDAILYFD